MAASNTRFTQNRLGQSKNPIDSDHGIYRYWCGPVSDGLVRRGAVRKDQTYFRDALLQQFGVLGGKASPDAHFSREDPRPPPRR